MAWYGRRSRGSYRSFMAGLRAGRRSRGSRRRRWY